MPPLDGSTAGLEWLQDRGVTNPAELNPCVPGEFTLSDAYYINTATPGAVYLGTGEGTLPLIEGRWYLIPTTVLDRAPSLRDDPLPVARSVRLSRRHS